MKLYHDDGIMNTDYYKRWTDLARMCYERGCRCNGCFIKENIENPCFMKTTVLSLVKSIGKPPEVKEPFFEGIKESEQKIVDAILAGYETKEEIAKALKTQKEVVQSKLSGLYDLAELNGMIFNVTRGKLPELVKFIKQFAKEKEND